MNEFRRRAWIAGRRMAVGVAIVAALLGSGGSRRASGQSTTPLAGFGPPLGMHDGHTYVPHHVVGGGQLIEDTNYGVQNPDLQGNTCFGVAWDQLYHSGQDLYRTDGSTAGAEISAVADGTVIYANPHLNYPGLVVIIEHTLPSGEKLYSVYAHIDDNSLAVEAGQQVTRGQRLGAVMYQAYSGRFPQRHPDGDDSHLHFELRHFPDGRAIYRDYPACNGLAAGRGYTYPQKPDDFPAPGAGYVDPAGVEAK
jgi:murein DD-endopeptidase MepM/ murein hydrolase activator NlpD